MSTVTVVLRDASDTLHTLADSTEKAGTACSLLIERARPRYPEPPNFLESFARWDDVAGRLVPLPRVAISSRQRMDRDRRRVYRRAVRRYKRLPPTPRQWTYLPRVSVQGD